MTKPLLPWREDENFKRGETFASAPERVFRVRYRDTLYSMEISTMPHQYSIRLWSTEDKGKFVHSYHLALKRVEDIGSDEALFLWAEAQILSPLERLALIPVAEP